VREASLRHFGIGQWTDFVRGTAAEADAFSMREHLESGCDSCRRVVASLRAVEQSGSERSALNKKTASREGKAATEVMELVWDSLRAPFQLFDAGPAESGRQLNFSSNAFELSARIEDGAGTGGAVLMARLHSKFEAPVAGFGVRLIADNGVIHTASTGELGQFELSHDFSSPVELRIALDGERELIAHLETGP